MYLCLLSRYPVVHFSTALCTVSVGAVFAATETRKHSVFIYSLNSSKQDETALHKRAIRWAILLLVYSPLAYSTHFYVFLLPRRFFCFPCHAFFSHQLAFERFPLRQMRGLEKAGVPNF